MMEGRCFVIEILRSRLRELVGIVMIACISGIAHTTDVALVAHVAEVTELIDTHIVDVSGIGGTVAVESVCAVHAIEFGNVLDSVRKGVTWIHSIEIIHTIEREHIV